MRPILDNLKMLSDKWKNRKRYPTYSDMPDQMITFFAATGFLISGYYGILLHKVVPLFLDATEKVPMLDWGWCGWYVVVMLALIGLQTWYFGSMAFRCNSILCERWFK